MAEESALIVPVPESEPLVGDLRVRYDPAAPAGIPAHITILYPFKTPATITRTDLDELGRIFAGVAPFPFVLTGVARFPDVVYLVPEPAESFVRLTAAIATRWPETPPYGGMYEQVVPHLTVAHTDDPATVAQLQHELESLLPVECHAREAWLLTGREGLWRVDQTLPFAESQHKRPHARRSSRAGS